MELVKQRRPVVVGSIHQGFGRFFELVREIGIAGAVGYAINLRGHAALQSLGFDLKQKHLLVRTKDTQYALYARYSTSDLDVFEQIFVKKEYSPLDDIESPKAIVDCGAYVGYSTAYFLNKFPHVRIVAVEADRENFVLNQKNLSGYGDRVTLVHSAIWYRNGGLMVVRGKYRDGQEWATQVRECVEGETADVSATDLLTLMDNAGLSEVDLLKIDIEGAERVIFRRGCEQWLDRVRNIAIELHDEECKSNFFNSLKAYSYDLSRSGELTICRNLRRKKADVDQTNS
jgi:FkbM family methyltransferase